ncbi:sensor histidine kinase [Hyalangium gracile]|uniref:sensor histidine kinase n=1 Tax=Hyalangium gracile TaxID=394092 RepID=UPI001CCE9E4B|nr:histidine kinase dimerization/phosphoacceptor domain -containing protein [Hyalangium gracile]
MPSPTSDTARTNHIPPIQDSGSLRDFLEAAPDAIVMVDDTGHIVAVNVLAEQMFGYSHDELAAQPLELLVPERYRQAHELHRQSYINAPRTRPMGAGRSLTGLKKDGSEFSIEISLSPLRTEKALYVISIIRDITERRRAEEQIKASLREKEVLLREIHHRVKNNLQVTSSLLKLQSAYIRDPVAKEMFAESQSRIRSMALVHEKLYRSSDLSRVDFADYVQSLASLLFRSYGTDPQRISLRVEGGPLLLSIETAVPCGLIVNELLSNSIKHAFPNGRQGNIVVGVGTDERGCVIRVADDGIGLPESLRLEQTETLGLQLVRTLAGQLRSSIELNRAGGTSFKLHFTEVRA